VGGGRARVADRDRRLVLPAQPYQAPWAWISFIGMCIVDDFLLGSREEAGWGELPKVALLAAVIVFRRHPEITVLIAVVAAPLGACSRGKPGRRS